MRGIAPPPIIAHAIPYVIARGGLPEEQESCHIRKVDEAEALYRYLLLARDLIFIHF